MFGEHRTLPYEYDYILLRRRNRHPPPLIFIDYFVSVGLSGYLPPLNPPLLLYFLTYTVAGCPVSCVNMYGRMTYCPRTSPDDYDRMTYDRMTYCPRTHPPRLLYFLKNRLGGVPPLPLLLLFIFFRGASGGTGVRPRPPPLFSRHTGAHGGIK